MGKIVAQIIVFIFILIFVSSGYAAEILETKKIKIGMPFKEAQELLKKVGAQETQLDMIYLGAGEERLYYLPDDRYISVILGEQDVEKVITHLSSFRINANAPKGDTRHFQPVLDEAKEIELNKINLILISDKKQYRPGEQIELLGKFKNVSDKHIIFNKYILKMKLLQQMELYSRYEGILYKIKDTTKYKLPLIVPEDFIRLAPGQNYTETIVFDTVFPKDSVFWYESQNTTSEWVKDLPSATYRITMKYENNILGLANSGLPITAKDHLKADRDMYTGTLISNTVEVTLRNDIRQK